MNFNKFTSGSFLKKEKVLKGEQGTLIFLRMIFYLLFFINILSVLTQTTINHAMHINVVVALSSLNILHAPADAVSRNE